MKPKQTIKSIQITTDNEPEFSDSKGVYARFGISRSLLYELANDGLIKSVSLRRLGTARGKRLWNIDSIRNYLHEQMKDQNQ